jgi:hypothetical protein
MTAKTAKEWAKELHDGADIYRKEGRHDLAERQDEVAALLIRLDKQVEAAKACSIHIVTVPGSISADCIAKLDAALAPAQDRPSSCVKCYDDGQCVHDDGPHDDCGKEPKEPCDVCGNSRWMTVREIQDPHSREQVPCPNCTGAKESQ